MTHTHPLPTAEAMAGRTIFSMIVQFPVVCFTLALFTDLAYWRTEHLMWHNFSAWLLFAGILFAALAVIAAIVDFLLHSNSRDDWLAWPSLIGGVFVLVLALFNNLVHAGDGWTAIVPWGIVLSAATVIVMIVSFWFGRAPVIHHRVGASDYD